MPVNTREPGDLLHGQLYDQEEGVVRRFTQQVQNFNAGGASPNLGSAGFEVIPVDANSTQDKGFDLAAATAARAALFVGYPCYIQMDLPDVLTNLNVYYNQTDGIGSDVHTGSGESVGDTWSIGFNLPGSAKSSITIIPEIVPIIERFEGQHVRAMVYRFYLTGDVTETSVIARLTSGGVTGVLPFPQCRPETFTFVLFGQQISLSADVNAQQQASSNDSNTTYTTNSGIGYSIQTGASVGQRTIPPCIHGNITIPNASQSSVISATASAGWTGSGAPPFDSVLNPFPTLNVTSTVPDQTATASVQPSVLAATSPAALPLYGLYLYDVRVEHYEATESRVLAYVVNMNVFGPSLSALSISHGTLYPTFAPGTRNYTATSSDSSITLTPTSQETATIKVNGVTVTSGAASGAISLSPGANRIVTVLTDASNRTSTYILVYTKT